MRGMMQTAARAMGCSARATENKGWDGANIKLNIPNANPKKAPAAGPNTTAPTITGMDIRVISTIPILGNPRGVKFRTIKIDKSKASCTIYSMFRRVLFFVFIVIPPCCCPLLVQRVF